MTKTTTRRWLTAALVCAATASWTAEAVAGEYPINACAVPGREAADQGPWVMHATGDAAFTTMPAIACSSGGGFGRTDASSMYTNYPFAGGFAGYKAEVPAGKPIELRRVQVSADISYTETPDSVGILVTALSPAERILCGGSGRCDSTWSLPFPTGTKSATLGVSCQGGGTCMTGGTYRQRWRWVVLTAAENEVPSVAPDGGSLLSGAGQRGTRSVGYRATDAESGVARLRVSLGDTVVADRRLSDDPATCSYRSWSACPTSTAGELDVDTTAVPDGRHAVTLLATDAAGNTTAADAGVVTVDNVAAPVSAEPPTITGRALVGELLRGSAGRWTGATSAAPLLQWKRCGASGCEAIAGATGDTYRLSTADAGLQVVLESTAANHIGETATADSLPTATVASSTASGDTPPGAPGGGAAAPLGDGRGLPNGTNASPRARLIARLAVGKATQRVRYGRTATVTGRLVDEHDRPIAGAGIVVAARTRMIGAPSRPVATVTTNDRGEFAYRAPSGPSRELTFGYRASSADRDFASTTTATLLVRAAVSLRATPARLLNGQRVRFTGTVRGRPQARNGVLLDLQVLDRGRWRSFLRGAVRANRQGRYRASYRFRRTPRATTYRFRAVARQDSAYPYLAGRSVEVRVRVGR